MGKNFEELFSQLKAVSTKKLAVAVGIIVIMIQI